MKCLVSTNSISQKDAEGLPPARPSTDSQTEHHPITRSLPNSDLQGFSHQQSQVFNGFEEPVESLVFTHSVSLNDARGPPPTSPSADSLVVTNKKRQLRLYSTEVTTYSVLVGQILVRSTLYETDGGNKEQRREVFFHPSPWLLCRSYTFLSRQSYGHWQHTFRSYNIIHGDHPVIDACADGDIELVQQICAQGQATPFDVRPSGWSLLHVRSE